MIMHFNNGAVVVLDQCHWTEGAYLSVTHSGGASSILDLDAIEQIEGELGRIKQAILDHRAKQHRSAAA
jgi:hypothetical protein